MYIPALTDLRLSKPSREVNRLFVIKRLLIVEILFKPLKEVKLSLLIIKILSPTDCIKDRLYKADEWDDDEAFDAAILVAKQVGFIEKKLKDFCRINKKMKVFEKFKNKLGAQN